MFYILINQTFRSFVSIKSLILPVEIFITIKIDKTYSLIYISSVSVIII